MAAVHATCQIREAALHAVQRTEVGTMLRETSCALSFSQSSHAVLCLTLTPPPPHLPQRDDWVARRPSPMSARALRDFSPSSATALGSARAMPDSSRASPRIGRQDSLRSSSPNHAYTGASPTAPDVGAIIASAAMRAGASPRAGTGFSPTGSGQRSASPHAIRAASPRFGTPGAYRASSPRFGGSSSFGGAAGAPAGVGGEGGGNIIASHAMSLGGQRRVGGGGSWSRR